MSYKKMKNNGLFIHLTADVSPEAIIGDNTKIWNNVQIREKARIGSDCIIGKNVYIDSGVVVGNKVKVQNNVSIFHGVSVEDGVFLGPHVCFTNDKTPRAINPDGSLKLANDWNVSETIIKKGVSIGANSTILCGITIGRFALIGAGSVVTKNVPAFGLCYGNPAVLKGYVCKCGKKLEEECLVCHVKLRRL